jgi:hypothetical protein
MGNGIMDNKLRIVIIIMSVLVIGFLAYTLTACTVPTTTPTPTPTITHSVTPTPTPTPTQTITPSVTPTPTITPTPTVTPTQTPTPTPTPTTTPGTFTLTIVGDFMPWNAVSISITKNGQIVAIDQAIADANGNFIKTIPLENGFYHIILANYNLLYEDDFWIAGKDVTI